MNIVVSELLTHYTRVGKGKLLLIIPGWADTSATWQATQQRLSHQFDVVVLDLPGFGGSQMPEVAWGLAEYADFVGVFVSKLAAGEPYAVLGHSNGGAIAIQLLSSGNIKTQKLLLLASAGIRDQERGRNQVLKFVAKTGKIVSAPLPQTVKQRLRQKLYRAAGSDMLVAPHMQETFKRVVSADVQAAAAAVEAKTLLIYGDKDADTPLRYGQMLQAKIKNSQLKIVLGAGHFVFLDQPELVHGYIEDFLK